jgi:hypothetical protein
MKTFIDYALDIMNTLSDEDLAYAAHPDRQHYRGFAALHDRMDANDLLEGILIHGTSAANRVSDIVSGMIVESQCQKKSGVREPIS